MSYQAKQFDSEQSTHTPVPDPYEACEPIDASSAGDVVDPWIRMQYPVGGDAENGVIATDVNFRAEQHADGSGVFMSHAGGAVYAVRSADGAVVGNEGRGIMWPYDADTESEVPAYIEVPFQFVGQVATEQTDLTVVPNGGMLERGLRDDETLVEGRLFMRQLVDIDILEDDAEDGVLLTHESGVQVYVGRDSTAYPERFGDLFGFVPFDGQRGTRVPTAADALDLLKPHDAVARPDSEVVRQGEWFLVDVDEPVTGPVFNPGVGERPYGPSPLESHVPRDWTIGTKVAAFLERAHETFEDLPDDVRRCDEVFAWLHDIDADSAMFAAARDLADGIYVRGSLRHRRNEHYMETVDDWRLAVTHDHEVLTRDDISGRVVVD